VNSLVVSTFGIAARDADRAVTKFKTISQKAIMLQILHKLASTVRDRQSWHNGMKEQSAPNPHHRSEDRNKALRSTQLGSEVVHPTGFEPVAPRLGI
jgi:hypothetical protein